MTKRAQRKNKKRRSRPRHLCFLLSSDFCRFSSKIALRPIIYLFIFPNFTLNGDQGLDVKFLGPFSECYHCGHRHDGFRPHGQVPLDVIQGHKPPYATCIMPRVDIIR